MTSLSSTQGNGNKANYLTKEGSASGWRNRIPLLYGNQCKITFMNFLLLQV